MHWNIFLQIVGIVSCAVSWVAAGSLNTEYPRAALTFTVLGWFACIIAAIGFSL